MGLYLIKYHFYIVLYLLAGLEGRRCFNLCTVLEGVASMLLATKINSRGLKMDKDGMVFFTIVIGSFFTFGVFFIAMIETLRFIFG